MKETQTDKRTSLRFDKVFPVAIQSELFGEISGVARNISDGGMFVEMAEPLPLESVVTVSFPLPDGAGEVAARAEVKHHYCLNFARAGQISSSRGIGLRFIEFLQESPARWLEAGAHDRILH